MIAGLKTTGAHDPVGDILMADANIGGLQKVRTTKLCMMLYQHGTP